VFVWIESRRRRQAEAAALRAARAEEAAMTAAVLESDSVDPMEAVALESIEEDEPPLEAAIVEEPAASPPAAVPDEGTVPFRLDDLRRARVLEAPPREVLDDPAQQQQWEEGLRLAEAHAASIGVMSLAASFEPQARCFAGMRDLGDVKQLRFFLFPGLWPTSTEQATAEAIYELSGDGVGKARVVRRS
jgi:hypothetical protein